MPEVVGLMAGPRVRYFSELGAFAGLAYGPVVLFEVFYVMSLVANRGLDFSGPSAGPDALALTAIVILPPAMIVVSHALCRRLGHWRGRSLVIYAGWQLAAGPMLFAVLAVMPSMATVDGGNSLQAVAGRYANYATMALLLMLPVQVAIVPWVALVVFVMRRRRMFADREQEPKP